MMSMNDIKRLFAPNERSVPIIHPDLKTLGRLWIPLEYVVLTNGTDRYLRNHPHAPSLCMLFQEGRCNSGSNCNQVHVDVKYASAIQLTLKNSAGSCCLKHGDPASTCRSDMMWMLPEEIELRPKDDSPIVLIPRDRFAVTMFWQRFVYRDQKTLFFKPDRVCILHQQNCCKFGIECKNVHICRELWQNLVKCNFDVSSTSNSWSAAPTNDFIDNTDGKRRHSKALPIVDPCSGSEISVLKDPIVSEPKIESPKQNSLSGSPRSESEHSDWASRCSSENGDGSRTPTLDVFKITPELIKAVLPAQEVQKKPVSPAETLFWTQKSEASRGKFKQANCGLLGVARAKGPEGVGFALGRGRPLSI